MLLKPQHDTVKFECLRKIMVLKKKVNLNAAIVAAKKLVELGEKMDEQHKADSYYYLSMIFQSQGDGEQSLKYLLPCVDIYKKLGKEKDLAQTYNQIANTYLLKHDNTSALNYYQQSLKIKEKIGDKEGSSNTLANIGLIYQALNNFESAIKYISKAADIKKEINDVIGYTKCLINLPMSYNRIGQYQKSLESLTQALRISDSIADPYLKSAVLGNLSETYMYLKDYKNAEPAIFECLKIREELADSNDICFTYITIAGMYGEQGNFSEAIRYALKAKVIAEKFNWSDIRYDAYDALATSYYETGNYKLSADYYFKLKNVGDSIYNEQNANSINEMEAKYQAEKKDAELKLNAEKMKNQQLEIQSYNSQRLLFLCALVLAVLVIVFVYRGYRQKNKANIIISEQKNKVEEQRKMLEVKNQEVTDSLFYARRIQRALLTSENFIKKFVPECFVFYKPKDIVSGDFYWASYKEGKFLLMTADCTGHGVPGAFMSLLGMNLLNEIVNEKGIVSPDEVLNKLRKEIITVLNPEDSTELSQDGMDAVFCSLDLKELKLEVACANNPVWLIRDNTISELYKPDKIPVGKSPKENVDFTLRSFDLQRGDQVYFLTDGYADQFGGPKGKKFKYKQLQEILLKNSMKTAQEQKSEIDNAFENWRGHIEQVDDILLIGLRV